MGKCLFDRDGVEVWQVLKKGQTDAGWVGVFNRSEEVQRVTITLEALGLDAGAAVQVQDVWNERNFTLSRSQRQRYEIQPYDVLFLVFETRRIESP
jgi:hypothetical protein